MSGNCLVLRMIYTLPLRPLMAAKNHFPPISLRVSTLTIHKKPFRTTLILEGEVDLCIRWLAILCAHSIFLPVAFLSFFFSMSIETALRSQWNLPMNIFDLMTLTLTSELDLDILPLDLHAKIQVRMTVRSAVRVRQTHRQTHTYDVKTITPVTSETRGVIICSVIYGVMLRHLNNRQNPLDKKQEIRRGELSLLSKRCTP